mmetsp:Transcript_25302/g.53951  ORF Transcript_25302/g.53951 Transcript_25302/m.53951 type:complete len:237 (-) Transcript_25302:1034-1744(-)
MSWPFLYHQSIGFGRMTLSTTWTTPLQVSMSASVINGHAPKRFPFPTWNLPALLQIVVEKSPSKKSLLPTRVWSSRPHTRSSSKYTVLVTWLRRILESSPEGSAVSSLSLDVPSRSKASFVGANTVYVPVRFKMSAKPAVVTVSHKIEKSGFVQATLAMEGKEFSSRQFLKSVVGYSVISLVGINGKGMGCSSQNSPGKRTSSTTWMYPLHALMSSMMMRGILLLYLRLQVPLWNL